MDEQALKQLEKEVLSESLELDPKATPDEKLKMLKLLKSLKPKATPVELTLKLIKNAKPRLLLDQLGEAYVVLPDRLINAVPVKSSYFTRWFRGLYFKEFGKGLSGENVSMVLATVEAQVFALGYSEILYNRWAFVNGELYFDMGDWQNVVYITSTGWQISKESPIHFRKFAHHKVQIDPVNTGDLRLLLNYVNLLNEDEKLLLLCHIPALCFPDYPRAALVTSGSAGAAKTTLLRLILSLVDPSETDVLRFQHDPKEIAQQAYKHYCLFYDNLSSLSTDQSDFLCAIVTGLSFSKRQLYSDDTDILWKIRGALGLSGVTLVPTRSDLLSRSLILTLESIPDGNRLPEGKFWQDFEIDKPKILAGLFDVLSKILASKLILTQLPRMADYALIATKAAVALGYTANQYLNAFSTNIGRQNDTVIEASPVAQTILRFMEDRDTWEGSSSELYTELFYIAEKFKLTSNSRDNDSFPKSANMLWKRITPIRPNLLELGIIIKQDRVSKFNLILLSKVPENASTTSMPPQQTPEKDYFNDSVSIDTSSASMKNDSIHAQHGNMETMEADLLPLDKNDEELPDEIKEILET